MADICPIGNKYKTNNKQSTIEPQTEELLIAVCFRDRFASCSLDAIDAIGSRYYDGKRRYRQHVDY